MLSFALQITYDNLTMPPRKKTKSSSSNTKLCYCGKEFTSSQFGKHVVLCLATHNHNSTRRLHHSGLQVTRDPQQQQQQLKQHPDEAPSLEQQRRMIINARHNAAAEATAVVQRHNDHQAKYKNQLKSMAQPMIHQTSAASSAKEADDGGGTESSSSESQTDGDDMHDVAFEETTSDDMDDQYFSSRECDQPNTADSDVSISIAALPSAVPSVQQEPLFPLANECDRNTSIRFKGTVAPAIAAGLQLMDVISKHSIDLSLYDDIVGFISSLADAQYNFKHKLPNRNALHNACEQTFRYNRLRPKMINVPVATLSKPTVTMPVFDVQAVLSKMLQNPHLMQSKNVAANYDVFTGTHNGVDDQYLFYDEYHTGNRWKNAMEHYINRDTNEFPCGLVVFYDKSHADRHGSLCVSPIMFTLTLFNKAARAQNQFWDILAYVPNLDSGNNKTSDSSIALAIDASMKCQDEHNCLHVALRQLKDVNDNGGIPMYVMGKHVRVKVWIHCVVGDIAGNNSLLGSFNATNVACPYRDCGCTKDDFVRPESTCTFITKANIDHLKALNNKDALKAASKHNIVNAFDTIPTGDHINTIYRLTPPETMHAINAGIAMRIIQNLGPKFKKKHINAVLNNLNLLLARQHSQQSERGLPRPSQRNNVLEVTKTQASEMMGNLFLIMCGLHTTMGKSACTAAEISQHQRKGKIETIMMVLSLEKWLNRRNVRADVDDANKITAFIRLKVIPNLQKFFPREEGMGWKFPKIHSLTKFPYFIQAYGSAINFYGGFGESHLKIFMKRLAHYTQRRPAQFAQQLAKNHYQHSLFNHSLYCIRNQTKSDFVATLEEASTQNFTGQHTITFTTQHGTSTVWHSSSSNKSVDCTLQYTIRRYIATHMASCTKFRITAFTTAKLPNKKETLEPYDAVGSHTLYRVDTRVNRNDWCMILTHQLGSEDDDERLDVWEYTCPGRIHGFFRFDTEGLPTPCLLQKHDADYIRNGILIDDNMYVVVQTAKDFLTWRQLETEFVVPFELGSLDDCTYILPVSRIANPLYVFEDHGQSTETSQPTFFATLPARYWAFYLDYKINPGLIPGQCGLSQKCEEYTD